MPISPTCKLIPNFSPMQTNKRKKDIVLGARKLIAQNGWDQWNLSELCAILQISLGNLTYYFPKKEQLIAALFELSKTEAQELLLAGNIQVKDYVSWEQDMQAWMKWWRKNAFLKDFQQIKDVDKAVLKDWEDLIAQRRKCFSNQWELMLSQKVLKSEKFDGQHQMLQQQYLSLERYNNFLKDERKLAVQSFFYHLLAKSARNNIELKG